MVMKMTNTKDDKDSLQFSMLLFFLKLGIVCRRFYVYNCQMSQTHIMWSLISEKVKTTSHSLVVHVINPMLHVLHKESLKFVNNPDRDEEFVLY